MEQERLLGDEADDLAQAGEGDLPHVDAVDLDRALVDVVQPRQQIGRRRLARPGRPDERDQLARLAPRSRRPPGRTARWLGRVGRAAASAASTGTSSLRRGIRRSVRDGRRAAPADSGRRRGGSGRVRGRGRVEGHRVGRVGDLRLQVEVLEDAVEQRQRALHLDLDVEQLAEREEEPRLERGEGDDVADRGRVGRPDGS